MKNHSRSKDTLFGSSNMIWDAFAHRGALLAPVSGGKSAPHSVALTPVQSDGGHERILEVAEKLIRRFGYAKTTMTEIAWELSLSRATIYRIFPTKEALHAQLCARLATQTLRQVRDAIVEDERPAEQLKALLMELSQLTSSRMVIEPHLHRLFVEAFHRQWDVASEYLREVNRLIEDTIAKGEVTQTFACTDARRVSRFVCGAMLVFVHPGLSHLVSNNGGDLSVDLATHVDAIIDSILFKPMA